MRTYSSLPKAKLSKKLPITYLHSIQTEYTHIMDIDYGKLVMPHQSSANTISKSQLLSQNITQEDCPETKRVQRCQITKIQTSLTTKKRNKGIQVNQSQIKKVKPFSYQRTQEKSNDKKKYFGGSSKRKVQTRVLKTIVGGGKMQTKLIIYPDNRAYLRLCGLQINE